MRRLILSAFLASSVISSAVSVPADAADLSSRGGKRSWCGTWDWGIEVALAKNEWNNRRLFRGFEVQSGGSGEFETAAIQIEQRGEVAVIRDDGTLIIDENRFDLEERSLKFVRRGKNGYKFRNHGSAIDTDLGDRLSLGDDDAVRVTLPDFEIQLFGKKYDSIFVNSDGNLTFGKADTASTPRDLQRLLNGEPRIAPFFADLDPSAASGDGGVYLRFAGANMIVTWWKVPEFGSTNPNTFQVSVNARGNAIVRFGEMVSEEGIVGVAPGGGSGLELIDLSEELPIKRKGSAMAERFTEEEFLDEASVAAAFYERYPDDFDQLVMFTDFGRRAGDNAIAYHIPVQNRTRGLGKPVYDGSRFFGSRGRLGGFINMGGESQYQMNVNKPIFWNLYSSADILAHELGHQWLVGATFIDDQGRESTDLLGRGNAHWSYYFDSDLSFLEGNEIREESNGLFTTLQVRATYNPFDRYLMGLIPLSDVPDKFYVDGNGTVGPNNQPASANESLGGTRVDISIDQLVAAMGERVPSVAESQKSFRIGFIVLVQQGKEPSQSAIDKANKFAIEIEKLFAKETGRKGSLDTRLGN